MRVRVSAVLLLAACASGTRPAAVPRPVTAEEVRQKLAEAEAQAERDESLRARAGWLRYLIASDPRGALLRLEPASRSGPAEGRALALAGLGEIAEDRTESETAAKRFIEALRAAPASPIAELAAIRLLDLEGESPQIDAAISEAARSLRPPAAPRAARLLREAAARIAARAAAKEGDPSIELEAWRAVGSVQRWRVGGPFGAFRLFDLRRAFALDGRVAGAAAQNDRALLFPDADVGLDLEPGDGDLYYAVSDVELAKGGDYLFWVEGAAALEARLNGAVVVSRVPYPFESPRAQTAAVRLPPGHHRVLVRWSRAEGTRFRVTLTRADGDVSDLTSAAPGALSGSRAAAPCELGETCIAPPAWRDRADLRAAATAMLEKDPADALGAWLLARATLGDDRAASRVAADRALLLSAGGAPALALHAQQLLHDPEVPDRIGRARALADLTEAAAKDPLLIRARLTAAALERDSERFDDAAQNIDKAESALGEEKAPVSARVLAARARLLEARGNNAGARARAEEALRLAPRRCDILQLLLDLSRRGGSLADQRRYAEEMPGCGDGLAIAAQSARSRGDLARAEDLLRLSAALRPAQPSRLEQLADAQSARTEVAAAIASLRAAAALAPRSPEPLRRLAGALELAGERKAATEARRAALRLAPGDFPVRQQVALDEGVRLMSWSDRDGAALGKGARDAPPGASAVRLLDSGAVQMFADGGGVERVHTVARVLDKKGIAKFGEAQLPPDAQILQLRTLKADGRVLEPESIPEKEGVSLPGLEPGDTVEIDWMRGLAPRGPDMPGWALGAFYFRDDETPMVESTYEVRSPWLPEVDAHNLELPAGALSREGDGYRFRYSARDVKPLPGEPHQTPESETLPWVQLGTGSGQKELMRSLADWALLRARPGGATQELAQRAAGREPVETAQRIYAAVAQAVRGRSSGTDLGSSAAHVLAQGRGNRLLVVKAALASAGIPSHILFVRTFNSDPAPYRFPRGDVYGFAVLRIDLPGGAAFIDPSYRLAPFGQLPAFVRGQDAWVLPEPGEEPAYVRLPQALPGERDGRELGMELALDAEGTASGTGRDEHFGFEAASLKDALERLDRDQRKQAVEAMLGRGLRGVTLESLAAEGETDLGGPATLVYGLRVPLARRDGAQLFLPASLVPARLARRWLQTAERRVPLLIDSPEVLTQRIALQLPSGRSLRAAPKPVSLSTPFGSYSWAARQEGTKLVIEESLSIPQQRVLPDRYAAFAAFARDVDQAQAQELAVGP